MHATFSRLTLDAFRKGHEMLVSANRTAMTFATLLNEPRINLCASNVTGSYASLVAVCYPASKVGVAIELTEVVCRMLGLSCIYVPHYENVHGTPQLNGSFDGIVGALIRREYDGIVPFLAPSEARLRVLDFTSRVVADNEAFLAFDSATMGHDSTPVLLFAQLNVAIWTYLILSLCLCTVLSTVFASILTAAPEPKSRFLDSLCTDVFNLISIIPYQGPIKTDYKLSTSSRIVMLFWSLGVFFLCAVLGAMVVSDSVNKDVRLAFNDLHSFAQALHKYKLQLVLTSNSSLITNKLQDPHVTGDYDIIRSYIAANGYQVEPYETLFDRLLQCPQCVVWHTELSLNTVARRSCSLQMVRDTTAETGSSFAFPKGSPYTIMFENAIQQLQQSGHIAHINSDYRSEWDCSQFRYGDLAGRLSLYQIRTPFYIWVGGLCTSALHHFVTLLYVKHQERIQDK